MDELNEGVGEPGSVGDEPKWEDLLREMMTLEPPTEEPVKKTGYGSSPGRPVKQQAPSELLAAIEEMKSADYPYLTPTEQLDRLKKAGLRDKQTRKYQIKELNSKHRDILRRVLLGQSNKEIALAVNCTPEMVSYLRTSQLGRAQLEVLHEKADEGVIDVAADIRALAPEVLAHLNEIRVAEETPVRVKTDICRDLLDRAGFVKPTRVETTNLNAHLSFDDLLEIKERARSAGIVVKRTEPVDVPPSSEGESETTDV
jgi:hypothetical protein